MIASARAYGDNYRASSLDHWANVPLAGRIYSANKDIVLNELNATDRLALKMLGELSKVSPASKTWTQVGGPMGDYREDMPVSPDRAAQIEAFEEIMQQVRKSKVLTQLFNVVDGRDAYARRF